MKIIFLVKKRKDSILWKVFIVFNLFFIVLVLYMFEFLESVRFFLMIRISFFCSWIVIIIIIFYLEIELW